MIEAVAGAGVTAPAGFRAAGVACGIKPAGLDLALVAADAPAAAAGLFTTNRAQAAPVVLSRAHLERSGGLAQALVVNSGCANACTGDAGEAAAARMAADTAAALGCAVEHVLVASTGVIGVPLDAARAVRGIADAARRLGPDGEPAARAIMTTDRGPKAHAVAVEGPAGTFRIGGMAKGAGMIAPMMATMLAFVTTDVRIAPALLRRALAAAARDTFNAITVDGDSSTNDCVLALASGASGVAIEDPAAYGRFVDALSAVCRHLALAIVRGAEGATRLVAIQVRGAASDADARTAARTIAGSLLVKTAVHGGDPNWGRLVAAAGRAGVPFRLERAGVRIGPVTLFAHGRGFDERAAEAAAYLRTPEVDIEVDLGVEGPGHATVWTCDLSAEYVRINAEYRT